MNVVYIVFQEWPNGDKSLCCIFENRDDAKEWIYENMWKTTKESFTYNFERWRVR